MIKIMNLRDGGYRGERHQFKVDRGTVLGNPYPMVNEEMRDQCCEKYKEWLCKMIQGEDVFIQEALSDIIDAWEHFDDIELWCWCAPKRCHAETIAKYVEGEYRDW